MATEQIRTKLQRWIQAMSDRNLGLLDSLADELYAENYVYHNPEFPDLPHGPEGARQFVHRILDSMPEAHITEENMIVEGDKIAMRATVRGTDASGKYAAFPVMSVMHLDGGKIVEEWELAGS